MTEAGKLSLETQEKPKLKLLVQPECHCSLCVCVLVQSLITSVQTAFPTGPSPHSAQDRQCLIMSSYSVFGALLWFRVWPWTVFTAHQSGLLWRHSDSFLHGYFCDILQAFKYLRCTHGYICTPPLGDKFCRWGTETCED